jgi:hypothetical protein
MADGRQDGRTDAEVVVVVGVARGGAAVSSVLELIVCGDGYIGMWHARGGGGTPANPASRNWRRGTGTDTEYELLHLHEI